MSVRLVANLAMGEEISVTSLSLHLHTLDSFERKAIVEDLDFDPAFLASNIFATNLVKIILNCNRLHWLLKTILWSTSLMEKNCFNPLPDGPRSNWT